MKRKKHIRPSIRARQTYMNSIKHHPPDTTIYSNLDDSNLCTYRQRRHTADNQIEITKSAVSVNFN